jgi:4'-phosphopantetheinyl transferase EntD
MQTENRLEREIERLLGITVRLSIARTPVDPLRLTGDEAQQRRALAGGPRLASWVRGRAALKQLLALFGESQDTSVIRFPCSRLSLTHSGDTAVAAGTPRALLRGIGIDLELGRGPSPAAARLFLTEGERRRYAAPLQPHDLLRLWTIKEALYKANPTNAETWFTDYVVADPGAAVGTAALVRRRQPLRMRYCSLPFDTGWLALAVLPRREGHHGSDARRE